MRNKIMIGVGALAVAALLVGGGYWMGAGKRAKGNPSRFTIEDPGSKAAIVLEIVKGSPQMILYDTEGFARYTVGLAAGGAPVMEMYNKTEHPESPDAAITTAGMTVLSKKGRVIQIPSKAERVMRDLDSGLLGSGDSFNLQDRGSPKDSKTETIDPDTQGFK